MQTAPELGIPDVKPAIESIRGRWVQKMSPQTRHSLLQGRLVRALAEWAGARGDVGPEWRFYLVARGEKPSSLVPDVAFVSKGRLAPGGDDREKPVLAPDIAVEILSPSERRSVVQQKISLYLEFGTTVVVIVDAEGRTIETHAASESTVFGDGETAIALGFPGLAVPVTALFEGL